MWGTDRQPDADEIRTKLSRPNPDRVWYLRYAIKSGMSTQEIHKITFIDPWFLDHLKEIVELEEELAKIDSLSVADPKMIRLAKQFGFSDRQLGKLLGSDELEVRNWRKQHGIITTFKAVDTCAAEFEAYTPYYYSTYEQEDEAPAKNPNKRRVMILGGGPNRIGQGIEFDYCCLPRKFCAARTGHRIGDGQQQSGDG